MLFHQLQEATRRIEEMNKEQESLIDIFSEERERRDIEEENLRKKLRVSFYNYICQLEFVLLVPTFFFFVHL